LHIIESLKQQYNDAVTNVFWSEDIVRPLVDSLKKNPDCFVIVCKLVVLFIQGCPNSLKTNFMRYFMACHNFFKFALMQQQEMDDDDDDDEDDDDINDFHDRLKIIDDDMEKILQSLCPDWQSCAQYLFNVFVRFHIYGYTRECDMVDAMNAMIFDSEPLDRIVRHALDQFIATPPEQSSTSRQLFLGMCIAYVAMCNRTMSGLAQFIKDLRSQLALGPEDPAFNFGCEHIAHAIICSICSSRYSPEAESLLSDCFAKSTEFAVSTALQAEIGDAMKDIIMCTGPDSITVLQKLSILAHSPVFVVLLAPYMDAINVIASEAGQSGEKYFDYLLNVLIPKEQKSSSSDEQHPMETLPEQHPMETMPPSYDEHIQQEGRAKQQPPVVESQPSQPPPSYDEHIQEEEGKEQEQHEEQPLGLPPSEDHPEMN